MQSPSVLATVSIAALGVGVLLGAMGHASLAVPCPDCAPCVAAATPAPESVSRQASRAPVADSIETAAAPPSSALQALEQRNLELERENDRLRLEDIETDPRFYGFEQADLELLASNCEVRSDAVPPAAGDEFFDHIEAKPEERAVIERVLAQFDEDERARKRDLIASMDVDLDHFDGLEPLDQGVLMMKLFHRPPDPDNPHAQAELFRAIAEEKANLRTPPTDAELAAAPPEVRYLRGANTVGDRFAQALADELGEDRVDELRGASGGWSGGGTRHFGCPDE